MAHAYAAHAYAAHAYAAHAYAAYADRADGHPRGHVAVPAQDRGAGRLRWSVPPAAVAGPSPTVGRSASGRGVVRIRSWGGPHPVVVCAMVDVGRPRQTG
ncbi:hypothetical protein SDC9_156351 [bioreactor metagenome]|uniref:Uncharacterized protein n=1 Tax=bioreactor metagenome TaxID=1076179 RepID=A0A645F9C0_9ZZZZ